MAKLVLVSKGTLSQYLKRLEDKGLIYKHEHGVYRFSLLLFREYLLDTRSHSV